MTLRAGVWIALLAVAAIAASACGGANGPASAMPTLRLGSGLVPAPSASGVPSPRVQSSPAGLSAASAAESAPARASGRPPSAGASAFVSASPSTGEVAFPNADEQTLLDHVKPTLRPSCQRAERFYPDEVDSVSCGGDSVPFVDYTLFPTVEGLRAAYENDVTGSESTPTAGGTCAAANYEDTYTLAGAIAGRLQCTTRTSSSGQHYKVIEWTHEGLDILSYISSETASWDDMINFWKTDAGPFG